MSGPSARVYVGLGSNLDGPVRQISEACKKLAKIQDTRLFACSPLYRNPPLGPAGQSDFVNAVAALDTMLAPHRFLVELQAIEMQHGRERNGVRWGARTLDLDLLLYGNEVIKDERLTLPHPGIAGRSFVAYPLHKIAPGLEVPGNGWLADLLSGLSEKDLAPVEEDW